MSRGYLLDTHVLLWWLSAPGTLAPAAREVIADGEQAVYVSAAAGWEMAIKKGLGRLDFPGNLEEILRKDHIDVLPITLAHALAVADLPAHHNDPFERVQVAQACFEGLTLITRDRQLVAYDVQIILA
jgi:PIN domain nuclease of toxin-antitoxin system